jgi:hypothetical protein
MIPLSINFEGDGALNEIENVEEARFAEVLVLDGGMSSGKPSVSLHFTIGERHFIAQTSARLFCTAARAITGRYPDLFED